MSACNKVNRRGLRLLQAERMLEVGRNARTEVVDSNHLVAFGQETVDQS